MTTESTGRSESLWRYTWEEWDSCLQEPLRDGERALLNILTTLGEPYNPISPPPLWDHEEFNYNPKNPEEIASYHYCLTNNNKFVFCGDSLSCVCDKSQFYYNLRNTVCITPKMIKGKMGLSSKENEKELQIQRRVVSHLSKQLRNNCDKIFDRSIPFVIEAPMLKTLCDAINLVFTNRESLDDESKEDIEFQDLVMFLSDFCQQTPSLCITYSSSSSGTNKALKEQSSVSSDVDRESVRGVSGTTSTSGAGGSSASTSTTRPKKMTGTGMAKKSSGETTTVDIALFKSLQILELRNFPPHKLTGLGSLRMNLQRIKCSRNLKSICHLLNVVGSTNVAQIWPELKELDLSYNRISNLLQDEISVLELCPSIEFLNLSRNRISAVGEKFSQLNSLSTINLSFNQLTRIPPIPPSVKVLLLSHNLIPNIIPPNNKTLLDPFNNYCPLKNLEVLDLSTNLISNESDLLPLKEMNNLQKLNLSGNPLSFSASYRRTVGGYLSRFVISRKFELDRKNLSSSEVKLAIDDCKEGHKFIPYIPASSLLISQANSAMSGSLTSGGSMSTSNSLQRSATSVSQLKSMSQSFDSSSSSMRSLRRKKPKIREITTFDFAEDRENSYSEGTSSTSIVSGSSSTDSKKEGIQQQANDTRKALKTLREKYGPEHWLLRQAGTEVDKLLRIPDRPINYEMFSRSLPQNSRELGYSSTSPLSSKSPPTSSCYYDRAQANERYTNEELVLINSRKGRAASEEEKTPLASPPSSDTNTPKGSAVDSDTSPEFLSCFDSCKPQEDFSIFDMTKNDPIDDVFNGEGKEFQSFKIFQNGEVFKLIVYDGYLMEVNPDSMIVLNQWDLNCLFALEEEKCDSETDSVQFNLKFDTMRKLMRERSFIMVRKEFVLFDKLVGPYIEERTLQEFTEALQCTKCFAQFSRKMAGRTVKHEKGQPPREVRICPNLDCGNDILVTLDNIPLPNNECLDLDFDEANLRGQPLHSSTPVFAKPIQTSSLSQSIPKKSPRVFDFMRFFPSSLTSRKSLTNEESTNKGNSFEDFKGVRMVHAANSVTPTSSDGGRTTTNTKSESDIEVLSTDSSSIEVLGKHCPDSGSEVDVEEAVEIPVIDASLLTKHGSKTVVMSESTSSSSCADSVVTTYEKNLLPISQPLSSPSCIPSGGGSSLCTNASFTSTSTLTTTSLNSPVHNTCMPIRYDYVNFKTDHRLQLWSDISVFKSDEELVAITKCMVVSDVSSIGNFLGIVIFSTKKVYLYRIIGNEGDRPQDWLQKVNSFNLDKFIKLDVLIGRHGVGVDFSGKYFALIFRDSERTSGFLEFFMSDICGKLKTPPMVRDFSQTQKMMLSPTNPISYFGIMRFAVCDSADNAYSVSAVLLTNEEILLITDLGWMAGRYDKVTTTHGRQLAQLRQVECMETDGTFIRLIFELEVDSLVNWELVFETQGERSRFEECLKSDVEHTNVKFICLSQPLES